jgi:hypothetical protein
VLLVQFEGSIQLECISVKFSYSYDNYTHFSALQV